MKCTITSTHLHYRTALAWHHTQSWGPCVLHPGHANRTMLTAATHTIQPPYPPTRNAAKEGSTRMEEDQSMIMFESTSLGCRYPARPHTQPSRSNELGYVVWQRCTCQPALSDRIDTLPLLRGRPAAPAWPPPGRQPGQTERAHGRAPPGAVRAAAAGGRAITPPSCSRPSPAVRSPPCQACRR